MKLAMDGVERIHAEQPLESAAMNCRRMLILRFDCFEMNSLVCRGAASGAKLRVRGEDTGILDRES